MAEFKRPLSQKAFAQQMSDIVETQYNENMDQEICHMKMDELMEKQLIALGYKDGIDIFRKTPKWYA